MKTSLPGRPRVLLPTCSRQLGDHRFQVIGEKYLHAVRLAGCTPLVMPCADEFEIEEFLPLVDGVLLTGSPSNVEPSLFGQVNANPSWPLDPRRDVKTLAVVRWALSCEVPLLAICRGLQELNVALGGTLHQAVHTLPGRHDHCAPDDLPAHQAYAPAHPVRLLPGGRLAEILGSHAFSVNSIHRQAIDRVAQGLQVEAVSDDGVIEACSVVGTEGFGIGVQWHPEWQAQANPLSLRLLEAFGAACRERRDMVQSRQSGEPVRAAGFVE